LSALALASRLRFFSSPVLQQLIESPYNAAELKGGKNKFIASDTAV
jgi:hypothetical protein